MVYARNPGCGKQGFFKVSFSPLLPKLTQRLNKKCAACAVRTIDKKESRGGGTSSEKMGSTS